MIKLTLRENKNNIYYNSPITFNMPESAISKQDLAINGKIITNKLFIFDKDELDNKPDEMIARRCDNKFFVYNNPTIIALKQEYSTNTSFISGREFNINFDKVDPNFIRLYDDVLTLFLFGGEFYDSFKEEISRNYPEKSYEQVKQILHSECFDILNGEFGGYYKELQFKIETI